MIDVFFAPIYNDVKKNCKGEKSMRKYYLDNIRWITIVLVVIYHVIYMYNGIATVGVIGSDNPRQMQDILQYVLYPWFMVILFILSGMCARYSLEQQSIGVFFKKRTVKLLVPSTLGLLVCGWVQGYISMSISNAFETMPADMPKLVLYLIMVLSGTGVLWFIQLLWLFSGILCLVRKFEKGKLYEAAKNSNFVVLLVLGVAFYLSGLVLNTPIIAVYRFGIYGFSFFVGYFVFAHEEVIDRLAKAAIPLLLASVACGAVYIFLHYGENYAVEPTVNSIAASVYGWIACLGILGAMKRYGNKKWAMTAYMTKKSFGIYVFHYLPLSALAYFMKAKGMEVTFVSYLLIGTAAFVGSLLLYEIVSRIPVLRWCILGMTKEKNVSR